MVIYDGKCVFCQKQVRNLRKFDGGDRLAFVSLHDPLVAERYPDLTYEQMMDQMYVIPVEVIRQKRSTLRRSRIDRVPVNAIPSALGARSDFKFPVRDAVVAIFLSLGSRATLQDRRRAS